MTKVMCSQARQPRRGAAPAYAEFREQVLGEEVAAKPTKSIAMRTAMARFPFVKPLETFDFSSQPSVDSKLVQHLASCHFIEHGDNVIVLGPPGVGKTHLAVSLGLKAIEAGYCVFTTAASLIEKHTKAHGEGRLEEKLKLYTAPRLLVIDEIRLPAHRPPGRQPVLPAHQPPLRAGPAYGGTNRCMSGEVATRTH